jgi:hypothetical protein
MVIAFGSNLLCPVNPPVIAAIRSLFIGLGGTTTSTGLCQVNLLDRAPYSISRAPPVHPSSHEAQVDAVLQSAWEAMHKLWVVSSVAWPKGSKS